jgi:hypothetical protein
MASQEKGPLYNLVVRGLVRAGESTVQLMFRRRKVLANDDLARVSAKGNIIFRGATLRSAGEFCRSVIGKDVPRVRSRVLIDGITLAELLERLSEPLPAPLSAPADYDRFRKSLAELIQIRFNRQYGGNHSL